MKSLSATEIAAICNGKIEGNPNIEIDQLATIQQAQNNHICFYSNPKYEEFLYKTQAGIILISNNVVLKEPISATLIRVPDAYYAVTLLMKKYEEWKNKKDKIREEPHFIEPSSIIKGTVYIGAFSYIGKNCIIGENVQIYPHVFIGDNTKIGDNSIIYSGAKVQHDSIIGSNVIIQPGAVIGSDGFGFSQDKNGNNIKIPQLGNVIIEDDVEIGANTTIDRGSIGATLIKKGTKIDNLVQIAHNVNIGKNCILTAFVGISGSAKIGDNVKFGGQTGVVGHIEVASNITAAARTGITKDIKDGNQIIGGNPAIPIKEAHKQQIYIKEIPNIIQRLQKLEEKIIHN